MTSATTSTAPPWTCPFCALLCDDLMVQVHDDAPTLRGGACPKAQAALSTFTISPTGSRPLVNGQATPLPQALQAAAALLSRSQQPLFAGMGTDVAGARALYRLACRTGAICDAAGATALMPGLTALQDRGGFTTTLAEVRARADLVVLVGASAWTQTPRLLARLGLTESSTTARQLLLLAPAADDPQQLMRAGLHSSVRMETVAWVGDIFEGLALLQASLRLGDHTTSMKAAPAMKALSERLQAAHYSVFVTAAASWPTQGALVVEAINNVVQQLNQLTRAAALWLSAEASSNTVNQVFSWLSGLPLRSRAGPMGLEHEPLTFETTHLLQDRAVDSLLWVNSFDATATPAPTELPLIVLGHPRLAHGCTRPGSVFFPVSTPGMGSAGHLFRTDGVVLMPLFAAWADGLPTVADVASGLLQQLGAA
jgi:formylmethanofuran dehydrogenase subunit B